MVVELILPVSIRRILASLWVLGLVAVLGGAARGEGRPRYGQTLVSSLLEEPLVVDPIAARTHADMSVIALVFDTLYRSDEGRIVPHLAAALPDAGNALQVRVPLRMGVQFHDGTPLRAQDVVLSLQRLKKSELGFLLEGIKRIEVASSEEGKETQAAVLFVLRTPQPELAQRLADLHMAIVPGGQAPQWRRLAGTGPWRLKARSAREKSLILEPNESHFAGRPYLDQLVLRWHTTPDAEARQYEAGATHVSARGQIAFAGHQPKYETSSIEREGRVLAYLGFGGLSSITSEPDFRQAVSAAIGRLGMAQIGSGEGVEPTTSVLAPRRKPRRFSFQANPILAKQHLRSLAKTYPVVESNGLTLQLIVNNSRPDDAVIAARVAAALFAHGINTRIVPLDADVFARRRLTGQCDLYIGQLAESGASPLAHLRKAFIVGKKEGLAAGLSGKTRPAVERLFNAELPIIPLFHRNLRLHVRSDVRGLRFTEIQTPDYPGVFFHGSPVKN